MKPHGSINWIGELFGGRSHVVNPRNSLGPRPFVDNADSVLTGYPSQVLGTFRGGAVVDGSTTLVLPTHEKVFSVTTSFGDEWRAFYESLWFQAEESLLQSDRIVVIGYSMPEADRRSRAVLLWSTNKRAEVIICCAASNAAMRRQFENYGFWRVREVGSFEDFLGTSAQ